MEEKSDDELTGRIIKLCFEVHNKLGPGFPEKVYHRAMIILLKKHEIQFETEKQYSVYFEGEVVGDFRCDLVIQNEVILELKAVEGYMPALFRNTVISYLKASGLQRALLINFGVSSVIIKRISKSSLYEIDKTNA